MSDSVRPHRWQPTRLPRPWDSPGKNTIQLIHFQQNHNGKNTSFKKNLELTLFPLSFPSLLNYFLLPTIGRSHFIGFYFSALHRYCFLQAEKFWSPSVKQVRQHHVSNSICSRCVSVCHTLVSRRIAQAFSLLLHVTGSVISDLGVTNYFGLPQTVHQRDQTQLLNVVCVPTAPTTSHPPSLQRQAVPPSLFFSSGLSIP